MKRFLILLLSLTVLSGCVFTDISVPTPAPASVLQTAVALTLAAQPNVSTATPTPAVLSQSATGTSIPAEAATVALPTPTETPPYVLPTAVPATPAGSYSSPILQTPDQFIRSYYGNINVANYAYTWSLLTDSFKAANNGPATGGYSGYVGFWNTVHEVVVQGVNLVSQNGGYAVVNVSALYHYNSGSLTNTTVTFNLTYNYSRSTWMFDSSYSVYYPPVSTGQTPVQFIFTYFYNINVSNFPYTWSLLTARFISHNNPPGTGGYTGYVNFWNAVHDVAVQNVIVNSQSGGFAVVVVTAIYNYNSGSSIYNTQTYNLTYDYYRGTWMFDSP
jgi:hypothetical protein